MQIPRVAYASTDEASSFSSPSDDEDCGSDELPASEYRPNNKRCMDPGECYPSEFELDRERLKYYNFMTSNDEWLSLNEINYLKYYINNCSSNMTSDPGDFRKSKKYLNLRG